MDFNSTPGQDEDAEEDDTDATGKQVKAVEPLTSIATQRITRAAKQQAAVKAAVRRSERSAKPRLVYVNNIPVLKSNMYDLEDGEPSVFDKELAAGEHSTTHNSTAHKPP